MSIVIESKQFEIPDEGIHDAEIIEIKDHGIVKTAFGDKHRVMIRYRCTDQQDAKGEPITCIESFNAVLGRRSRLAERIESLTGQHPGGKYDLDTLVGWTGQIVIQHKHVDGKTYANVVSVLRKKAASAHGDDEVPW
jgi:hypothetical protein